MTKFQNFIDYCLLITSLILLLRGEITLALIFLVLSNQLEIKAKTNKIKEGVDNDKNNM